MLHRRDKCTLQSLNYSGPRLVTKTHLLGAFVLTLQICGALMAENLTLYGPKSLLFTSKRYSFARSSSLMSVALRRRISYTRLACFYEKKPYFCQPDWQCTKAEKSDSEHGAAPCLSSACLEPLSPFRQRSRGAACLPQRPLSFGKAWTAQSPSASRSSQTGLRLTADTHTR